MKRKVLALLGIVGALSLSGCSFFNIITSSTDTSVEPWSKEKQKLAYTCNDLSPNHYYNLAYMPTNGDPKLLVLPILLTDSNKYINEEQKVTILDRLDKMAFGKNEDTGWYSISSFYETESLGECVISGEVADWYQSTYSYEGVTTTEATNNVVKAALADWKTKNPEKIKDFDTNNDGYIDGLLVIYGAPDYKNMTGRARNNTNMWAYTSWLDTDANLDNPSGNAFIWASYDFMDADNTQGMVVDAHTYIHEMGHVMGLDDYYDYSDHDDVWAGGFSMQDYNVGGHDPFSLMTFGWVNPYVPTSSTTINIKPFTTSHDVIVLSPDFSANSPYDEYVMIEYYTPDSVNERDATYQYMNKYPLGPDKGGIRIWHVDARLLKITDGKNRRGQSVKQYSITNKIVPGEGSYIVGCTNTTYTGNKDTDAYCSLVSELRGFRLIELIRRADYTGSKTNEYINNSFLFKGGDTFSLTQYSGYFPNGNKFNNGSKFNYQVKINYITSEEASITITL